MICPLSRSVQSVCHKLAPLPLTWLTNSAASWHQAQTPGLILTDSYQMTKVPKVSTSAACFHERPQQQTNGQACDPEWTAAPPALPLLSVSLHLTNTHINNARPPPRGNQYLVTDTDDSSSSYLHSQSKSGAGVRWSWVSYRCTCWDWVPPDKCTVLKVDGCTQH